MANQLFTKKIVKATFDTAGVDSTNVANTTVASHGTGVYIPSGAIVTNVFYRVRTTFTDGVSDAGTIALTLQSAGDLKAAIAISAAGDVWDAGVRACLPSRYALDGNALTAIAMAAAEAASLILTTAQRELTVTVGGVALTAGAMDIYVEYVS